MVFCSVGVGFSYAEHGETVETTEDAAKNIYAFITIFFETFPQFAGRPLHLAGESYGVSRHWGVSNGIDGEAFVGPVSPCLRKLHL